MSTLRRVLRTVTKTINFLSAFLSVLEIFLGILGTKDRLNVMYVFAVRLIITRTRSLS